MSDASATLAAEAEARRWAVPAAALGAALTFLSGIASIAIVRDSPENLPARYLFLNDHAAVLNVLSAVRAVGIIATGIALWALFLAVRARREQRFPKAFGYTALVGGTLAALAGSFSQTPPGLVAQVVTGIKAGDFASQGPQTYQQIVDLSGGPGFAVLAFADLFGTFCLAAAIFTISLNAMRVGLLSRLLGYVGIFAAIFTVFPLGQPIPVVMCFWLAALAFLFSGRFFGRLPPAWTTGEAEPWPSMAEQRERAQGLTAPDPVPAEPVAAPADASARPAAPAQPRRKRKKRR